MGIGIQGGGGGEGGVGELKLPCLGGKFAIVGKIYRFGATCIIASSQSTAIPQLKVACL